MTASLCTRFLRRPAAWVLCVLLSSAGCLESQLAFDDPLPVADAGWDQIRYLAGGTSLVVDLDGRASCDPLGAPIGNANWAVVQAPPSSTPLVSAIGGLQALFEVDAAGSYLLALHVTANARQSEADFVEIDVREGTGDDVIIGAPQTNACGGGLN